MVRLMKNLMTISNFLNAFKFEDLSFNFKRNFKLLNLKVIFNFISH